MSLLPTRRAGRKPGPSPGDPLDEDHRSGLAAWLLRTRPRHTVVLAGLLALSGAAEGVGLLTLVPLLGAAGGGGGADGAVEALVLGGLDVLGVSPSLAALLGLVVAALALKALFRWLAMVRVGAGVAGVARDLRVELAEALLRARWSHVADARAGALSTALGREAFWAAYAYRHACGALAAAVQVLVYAGVVVAVSWRLGLVALLVAAALAAALGAFVRMSRRAGADLTERSRDLASSLLDVVGAVKAIRAMGREGPYLEELRRRAGRVEAAERRQVVAVESLHAVQEPVLALVLAPAIWLAVTWGDVPLSTLLVAVFLFHRLVGHAHRVQVEYQGMAAAEAAFRALRGQILEARRAREPAGGGAPPPPLERGIVVEGVTFAHGGRTVLDGASLEIPARRLTALVGPSGVGKTTLLDLLAGLRRPDSGSVSVDGIPLDAVDPAAWRRRVGYVPQEPVLLRDTVARNVTMGAPGVGAPEVEAALRAAGAWDFVAALPRGPETGVGERGARLSGGQRQRIAVARALLHRPALLVLDEATSELDAEGEAALVTTLLELRSTLTVVAATHRGALAERADRVWELSGGRAVERSPARR